MKIKEFENVIKGLDRTKYHIGRTLGFAENGELYISKWDIFRKDMSMEEYFDPKNLAVLSSDKGHTIEDIEKLIMEENNVR